MRKYILIMFLGFMSSTLQAQTGHIEKCSPEETSKGFLTQWQCIGHGKGGEKICWQVCKAPRYSAKNYWQTYQSDARPDFENINAYRCHPKMLGCDSSYPLVLRNQFANSDFENALDQAAHRKCLQLGLPVQFRGLRISKIKIAATQNPNLIDVGARYICTAYSLSTSQQSDLDSPIWNVAFEKRRLAINSDEAESDSNSRGCNLDCCSPSCRK